MNPGSKRLDRFARWAGIIGVVALWAIANRLKLVPSQVLPSPLLVCQTFIEMLRNGLLFSNLLLSVRRVLLGFGVGAAAGLLLGTLIGSSPVVNDYFGATFLAVTQIPIVGWIPLFMMVFGLGESLKLVVVALASLIPVVVNTRDGIANVPRSYLYWRRL
jgi:sulfonate transport system permease protein